MEQDIHPSKRIPTDAEVAFILKNAGRIQDWEARAGQAFTRLRKSSADGDRVRATYERWVNKGREEHGPHCPLKAVTGYAVWALRDDDESEGAKALRKVHGFLEALTAITMRVHHTYMDEMLETQRGGAFYALEIDAEAVRIGAAHDYDPAVAFEAMDEAVRIYLARAGHDVAQREPISDEALSSAFHEGMKEMTEGFVDHMRVETGVEFTTVRLGRFPE